MVQRVHAVLLSGGSAFGLDAASGAMRFLEESGVGYDTRIAKVPIVPAAILFDLGMGNSRIRPDAAMGYAACQAAGSDRPQEGNHGAGTGAAVGGLLGPSNRTKSGIGTASIDAGGGVVVGALMAVNAFGDVVDPADGSIIAGARPAQVGPIRIGGEGPFANTFEAMRSFSGRTVMRFASGENTVIGVVATNARLQKEGANKVAQMAQDGVARAIRPAHTMLDGDTIFALATGEKKADVNIVGAYAAEVVAQAIVNAVRSAESAGGLPASRDLLPR
jgi:L-aminopeptidase/D-esterase-like protein